MKKMLTGCFMGGFLFLCLCGVGHAGVKVGGVLGAEAWYSTTSEDMAGGDETNEVWLNGGNLLGELNVDYADDSGAITIHTMIKLDGQRADQPTNSSNSWRLADDLYLQQISINWHVNDAMDFKFGKQNTLIAPFSPRDCDGPVWLSNVGNLSFYDEIASFRFDYKLSNQLKASFLIGDPDSDNNDSLASVAGAKEENIMPRIDFSLQYETDSVSIIPAVTFLSQNYDNLPTGYDDTINIWAASLSAEIRLDALMIRTEGYYGENLGDGNYTGADGFGPYAYQGSSILEGTTIYDTTTYGGFFELMYTLNEKTQIGGAVSMATFKNDDAPANRELDVTDIGYSLTLHYMALANLLIAPQIRIYDFDDSAMVDGVEQDHGTVSEIGFAMVLFF